MMTGARDHIVLSLDIPVSSSFLIQLNAKGVREEEQILGSRE